MDAGFLNVVEIEQYVMTKDTAEFSQFHAVACREYTLLREDEASQPKGWIQGNTKIGPVFMSMNKHNSHSWVRVSRGSNKFAMNLSNNEQEIPEVQLEEYALKIGCERFCMPIKGQSKTTKKRTRRLFHKNNTY